MFGLSWTDLVIIGAYFAAMIAIGIRCKRRISNQVDFFLGGRAFGKGIQTFAAFGMATSDHTAVATTTTTFSNGASGIWSNLNILFATPTFWLTSPWYRRLRTLTLADFFSERYQSRRMGMTYALVAVLGTMANISIGFAAMAKTIQALTPKAAIELNLGERTELQSARELADLNTRDFAKLGPAARIRLEQLQHRPPRTAFSHVDRGWLIFVVASIVLVYASLGGLRAAYMTDLVQGVFIIILSVLLLPFAWHAVNLAYGGSGVLNAFAQLHRHLAEPTFDLLGSPGSPDFTWYFIAASCVLVSVSVATQPNQLVANGSARDEYAARYGFTIGIYLKRFVTVLWGVFALFAILLYTGKVNDPDLIWGYASLHLLGPLHLGLIGLMIACLLAALMASTSSLMLTASSLLDTVVYRSFAPGRSERHYVTAGRVFNAVVVFGAAWIAIGFDQIFALLKFNWGIYAIFAASFWLGMLWRPSTRAGAWSSVLVSLFLFLILPSALPALRPSMRTDPALAKMTTPLVAQRTYVAHAGDLAQRQEEIAAWEHAGRTGPRPAELRLGDRYTKNFRLAPRSIFWTQDVRLNDAGVLEGRGPFNLELYLIDRAGFNLGAHPLAFNEALRLLLEALLPFAVLIVVSRLTRTDNVAAVDRFYAKMKTKVRADPADDARELALSYAEPHRFDGQKLFPRSHWEFCRWDREDGVGFLICASIAGLIIAFLVWLIRLGS